MKSQEYQKLQHEFAPVYDTNSKILILGSFPSVKSREQQFFYGHPQNRFWKVIAALTNRPLPQTIEEKKRLLLENRIAVWDVIAECEIIGSSDSSIRNAVPNDLHQILDAAQIQHIYTNGGTAKRLYEKFQKDLAVPMTGLPSTSPANAAFTMDRLLEKWKVISPYFHCESHRDPK